MPLTKAQKALYEAALRRKGLQPGKAVRQDPRTFVGPIEMHRRRMPSTYPIRSQDLHGNVTEYKEVMVPSRAYWSGKGRFQDLEDELSAARDAGIYESKDPLRRRYYRYYNDGDIPYIFQNYSVDPYLNFGGDYESPYQLTYRYPTYRSKHPRGTEYAGDRRELTRLGQRELEARADEMIENDYKDYLRRVYSRWPTREDALREIPFYHAQYLDDLYPVK